MSNLIFLPLIIVPTPIYADLIKLRYIPETFEFHWLAININMQMPDGGIASRVLVIARNRFLILRRFYKERGVVDFELSHSEHYYDLERVHKKDNWLSFYCMNREIHIQSDVYLLDLVISKLRAAFNVIYADLPTLCAPNISGYIYI
jgi:hypothetical protein